MKNRPVFKGSQKRIAKGLQLHSQRTQTSLRRLQDVLKISRRLTTKQTRPPHDVWHKASDLRRLENVELKPS